MGMVLLMAVVDGHGGGVDGLCDPGGWLLMVTMVDGCIGGVYGGWLY